MRKLASLLMLLCLFTINTLNAQNFNIQTITLPTNPSNCTNSDVIANCIVGCGNFTFDSIAFSISPGVIDIGVYYQSFFICLPVISTPSHTANLGQVPAGTYAVNVTAYLNMGANTTMQNTVSGNMTVSNCCNATASIQSSTTSLCQGDTAYFQSVGSGVQSQEWYVDGQLVSTDTAFNFVFDSAGTSAVQLVVFGTSCADSVTQNININALPNPDLGMDTTFCENDSLELNPGGNWASILWFNGSTGNTVFVDQSGIYFVSVTDQNGCENSDTIVILQTPGPIVQFGSPDTFICFDELPFIANAYNPNSSYLWHDGSTDSAFALNGPGWAACTVTDANGCKDYDSIFVIVLICDGLEDMSSVNFDIYPNPASEKLTIRRVGDKDIKINITINEAGGKVLRKAEMLYQEFNLDLNGIKPGTYFLNMESKGNTVSYKFIRK